MIKKTTSDHDFIVAVATNNDTILNDNLLRSPMIKDGIVGTEIVRDAPSASIAYNTALDNTTASIVIFAHHDVYFPHGWDELLRQRIAEVDAIDPNWAVLGAFGIGLTGAEYGPVWSTSLGRIVGSVPETPQPVQSYDELVIILRRDSGLRFDPGLPNFHLYGTDIVASARQANRAAYAAALPLVHNDGYHDQLGDDYSEAYGFMQRKWRDALPLRTPITKISRHGLHLYKSRLGNIRSRKWRQAMAQPTDADPARYAALCGWNNLVPV
ncbi:hypothetical protein GCM10007385_15900 [Tateyamaria omphalii]|uniref:hypothetical protein n=1 Tax=Tateyamaria omphalii TaxID=299262 RepID=UPI0016754A4A|nr:hypothetical protein [Tateyamaria omphalii]GGX48686.1 hypothetical protein GCM10007385_15900 [Tateyamaria omphalii]